MTNPLAKMLLAALLLSAAACTTPVPDAGWHFAPVDLPAAVVPRTLAVYDGGLLIAGQAAAEAPTLQLMRGDGITAIPLHPVTGYAAAAGWTSVVTTGSSVAAVGGARGGAHGNVRWTVWFGDATGVSEQEQPFETFGGWGAGHLTGLVVAPEGAVGAVGSWASAAGGQDIAVWQRDGARYIKRSSEGTPLASTATEQINPSAAVGVSDGVVIVGNATALGTDLRVAPALWHAPGLTGPWTRVDLPTNATMARARAVSCTAITECVVLGAAGDLLAGWQISGAEIEQVDVPELQVAAQESATVVDGDSGPLGLAVSDGRMRIFRVGSQRATLGPPAQSIQAAVRLGDAVFVIVHDGAGTPVLLRGTQG